VTNWHEIVVHASDEALRAFVEGFAGGRGEHEPPIVFGSDLDLEPESLGERLKDLFVAGSHLVLLAPEPFAVALLDAFGRHGPDVGVRIERSRVLCGAQFAFHAEVFNRPLADALRDSLRKLPEGVSLVDVDEKEEVHPEAEGVELYAPLHRYVYRVSGTVRGELPGVLEMQRRLRAMESVELERLHLQAKD
jgi:hypothetical protein